MIQKKRPKTVPTACRWLLQYTPPIQCISLGGSHARGDARPSSDLDVFVFTEDDAFPDFVRKFPKALVDGLSPVFANRPPTLTRGFGFQFSAFSESLGPIDYFLLAPFVIQPFDRFKGHRIMFNHNSFFESRVLNEESRKSDIPTAQLLGSFEFRLASLYTEIRRSVMKGEVFKAQQALLELRSYAHGIIKTIISGELFDYTTKARRGDQNTSLYYDKLDQCVRDSGMDLPGDCANEIIGVLMEAMTASKLISETAKLGFASRFETMTNNKT